jgi:transcription initiation factor TFIIIB Brf1 subunit/transcription initiation factor TFIIB
MQCRECHSIDLVEVVRDGDLVCRQCGLVHIGHMIDTRPLVNQNSIEHYEQIYTDECSIEFIRAGEILHIPESVLCIANDHFSELPCTKGQNRQATMARCLYKACQESNIIRSREAFCAAFQITDAQLTSTSNIVVTTNITTQNDIRTRFAANAQHLVEDEKVRRKLLNACAELEQKMKENTHFTNTKPSKMDGVVFFYVAEKHAVKLNKKSLINVCGMSNVTFNKHLAFLRKPT